ncbi:MAG: hypothetical protein A3B86_04205 [Candidatus Yanofskybacteria bacterium RIFCSPHIGHO2_02_FULL_38_22b]|uniref:Uncharacterized protein n=1 Tax=Candidatus Yanofskybacteria bacterium RIFCSPHIGHO2_02_FULL_38_22b TaxID=1802673 RepID=A0A1F8EZL0_9BACT|nr:MAG: hypothetical protein A2816_01975 [Candidatus Yanofskybacteria bacterium RIFCSPHIGHO2_01_FULL_39_44]OGN06293.1 MAG: hypothetical protein A3B86_04205 [Candidatus Yanofskybacteria bacterium RIFCSPHIGHO2_02_FULL_38_22b]OGN19713.1 MAG: hypothetical protein A2910_03940 [Candidatus Yanofskybacteria bacterium RIFCSPLOWO2_01_FULL_39_28]
MTDDNKILVYPSGKLIYKDKELRAALGKSGVVLNKQEGDGATPVGCFSIRKVYYRADWPLTLSLS